MCKSLKKFNLRKTTIYILSKTILISKLRQQDNNYKITVTEQREEIFRDTMKLR